MENKAGNTVGGQVGGEVRDKVEDKMRDKAEDKVGSRSPRTKWETLGNTVADQGETLQKAR